MNAPFGAIGAGISDKPYKVAYGPEQEASEDEAPQYGQHQLDGGRQKGAEGMEHSGTYRLHQ